MIELLYLVKQVLMEVKRFQVIINKCF